MKYMKRAACFMLAALTLAACFGCAGPAEPDGPDLDPEVMVQAMMEVDTTLPEMVSRSSKDEDAKDNFFYLSDMDYKKVDAYFYVYADAGTAEELAVVKLKDSADAAALMDSLHDHLKARQGTFEEYAPEQAPLTESAVITREGRYVVLIVSKKNGLAQNTFRDFFKDGEG